MMALSLSTTTQGWLGLALALFLTSFGPLGGLWVVLNIIAFLAGCLTVFYTYGKQKSEKWLNDHEEITFPPPSIGIPQLVEEVKKGKKTFKTDKRMTGSIYIDEVLQEVLDYTYRDYIHTWYRKISDDEQFRHDIRMTLQRVIIAFSERSKEVELVPYFTTRLVDDFASHLRLYTRALEKVKEHKKDETKPPPDLESIFFDLETEMENNMCRDVICLSEESERKYLEDLCEVLLFLLLPPEDFHNRPFRYIVKEVLVNGIFIPFINLVSDPDYVNQTVSWMSKDFAFTSETFLTVLKTSDTADELQATKAKVDLDIARQRSKDTGGIDDTEIKQQLSSLLYVREICEKRTDRLNSGLADLDSVFPVGWDSNRLMLPGQKLYALPFDVILNNNIALSYFIEYMTNVGAQGYLFFYLTIEAYKVSAEQQISAAYLLENGRDAMDLDMLKEAAISIYNQYLSDKASPKLVFNEQLVAALYDKIFNKTPSDTTFDEIQARVCDLLQDEHYHPGFKKSQLYIRLLAELDLLKDKSDDGYSESESDCVSGSSKCSSLRASQEDLVDSDSSSEFGPRLTKNGMILKAEISNTGICKEHGKSYAVYMVSVMRTNSDGTDEKWDVYRRYSDFHDLHMTVLERYPSLSGVALPSKKTFNNMSKEFLEKRRSGLNVYLQSLLTTRCLNTCKGLLELVHQFLEHMVWEKDNSPVARKMDTLVNPFKVSMKNMGNMVKSMPDNFVDGVVKMSGGIKSIPSNMIDGVGKVLNVKGRNTFAKDPIPYSTYAALGLEPPPQMSASMKAEMLDRSKVGASLEEDDQEIIPLRIMLLLMDEVFDLKSRNQWLRRRIVAILRQIIKSVMGDSINRKIVDHVEWMTSSEQVAEYVKTFRDAFWPGGILAEPRQPRDSNTKMRTRVVCKAKMLGSISDEIRHLIGSETTRQGVIRVFNMFQHQRLNKRMVYVILEGVLETLFPDNKFQEVFRKLHSRSARVNKDGKDKDMNKRET